MVEAVDAQNEASSTSTKVQGSKAAAPNDVSTAASGSADETNLSAAKPSTRGGVSRLSRRVVPVITKAPPPEAHGAGAPIRVLQWNILADGLSDDGFLVRGEDANDAAQQDARIEKIMARVREAKSSGDQREAKMLAVSGSALN
jgi:hypothetical protein